MKELYNIRWTQAYVGWAPMELEIVDLTEARTVLARIMSL